MKKESLIDLDTNRYVIDCIDALFLVSNQKLAQARVWKKESLWEARQLRLKDIRVRLSRYLVMMNIFELPTDQLPAVELSTGEFSTVELCEDELSTDDLLSIVNKLFASDEALAAWYLSGEYEREKEVISSIDDSTNHLSKPISIKSTDVVIILEAYERAHPNKINQAEAFKKRITYYAKLVRDKKAQLPCPIGKGPLTELMMLHRLGRGGRGGGHTLLVPAYLPGMLEIFGWSSS
jgi:hypothetical protein